MAESLRKSLDMPIKLLENLFGELSLNDSPFIILKPATSAEIIEYEYELDIFGDLRKLFRKVQMKNFQIFQNFLETHSS